MLPQKLNNNLMKKLAISLIIINKKNKEGTYSVYPLSYRNTCESLGDFVMLQNFPLVSTTQWKHGKYNAFYFLSIA